MTYLAIVDRAYRGTLEAQFFDAFYGVLTLGTQIGGLDVVLRGTAVTAAVAAQEFRPGLRLGTLVLDGLPDQRSVVRAMLDSGIAVHADEPDLAALGLADAELVPGVQRIDTNRLAERWPSYQGVWFL